VVGREGLRAAEEGPDADRGRHRDALQGRLDEGRHPLHVERDRGERRVVRDAVELPRRGLGLEDADHHPAALLAVVAEGARVLEDRVVGRQAVDRVGDQVVVLSRLVGDDDAIAFPELARPHAGAVDDELALDVTRTRPHPGHAFQHQALGRDDPLDGDPFEDADPEIASALGVGHRQVDRIDAAVIRHPEATNQAVHLGEREELGHLLRRHLVRLQPHPPLEDRGPPVLLHPALVERLHQATAAEPGRHPRLGLEAREQITGVHPDLGARTRRVAERRHEPGRVPGRAAGQLASLEKRDIGDADLRQVVGDVTACHTTADDRDFYPFGKIRCHARTPLSRAHRVPG